MPRRTELVVHGHVERHGLHDLVVFAFWAVGSVERGQTRRLEVFGG